MPMVTAEDALELLIPPTPPPEARSPACHCACFTQCWDGIQGFWHCVSDKEELRPNVKDLKTKQNTCIDPQMSIALIGLLRTRVSIPSLPASLWRLSLRSNKI